MLAQLNILGDRAFILACTIAPTRLRVKPESVNTRHQHDMRPQLRGLTRHLARTPKQIIAQSTSDRHETWQDGKRNASTGSP